MTAEQANGKVSLSARRFTSTDIPQSETQGPRPPGIFSKGD